MLDPPYLDGADGDVGAAVHEVLLEVDPFAAVTCLDFDPRLHRIVGHRQNANPGDTQPIGQLSGDARWRPAGRKQLGAPQMCRQIHVAEAEPRFAIQPLERVHAAKRATGRTFASLRELELREIDPGDHVRRIAVHQTPRGRPQATGNIENAPTFLRDFVEQFVDKGFTRLTLRLWPWVPITPVEETTVFVISPKKAGGDRAVIGSH